MNKHPLPVLFIIVVPLILAASCVTSKPGASALKEDEILRTGAELFAQGKITEAEKAWGDLPDSEKRSLYLSFAEAYSSFDAAVTAAERALSEAGPEAAIAASRETGLLPSAPPAIDAVDPRNARERLARVEEKAANDLMSLASNTERAADAQLASARSGKDSEHIAAAGAAAEGFTAAVKLFTDASEWVPDAAAGALRAEEKTRSAEELRKALYKESLLSFPDRMGQVFARSPSSSEKLGDMELLAFNAETAKLISGGLSDFERIVSEYPDLLDTSTLDRYRDSARALTARFIRIETVIKTVKNRGRPVMPILIGIFNPEPDDPQRSRPASFAGRSTSGAEWWWGIADIPKGLAQDLVISMSDSRPIRIYAAGIGSGEKKPASDLVNPNFKVGNSWPVLNAGARLDSGVFHIEVGPGNQAIYRGQAVVYKSFMMRTR